MSEQENPKKTMSEEVEMVGNQVLERVQDLVKQGNVRRIVIRTSDGRVIMDTTLTVGALAGGTLALVAGPFVTAIAAIAAIVGRVKVEIVREVEDDDVVTSDAKSRVRISSEDE